MRRTQLLLEEWQYEALRTRAEREGTSLSSLVRGILAAHLGGHDRSRLEQIEGLAAGPRGLARDHDEHLYGTGR